VTDEELIAESFRLEPVGEGARLLVRRIWWDGHQPQAEWDLVAERSGLLSPEEHHQFMRQALGDPRYFRRCGRCGELQPSGWMHDATTCQTCAERHLGVVY
jgi:hypothetical protein